MPDTIHTKAKMYRYLKSGRLGNTAKIYTNIHDIPDTEIVDVRYAEVSSMGRCIYGISKQKLHTTDLTNAVISEYPQSKASVVLNAEIMNSTNGTYLRYKIGNMVMRKAMKNPDVATGLISLTLLRYYMDSTSLDTLMDLLHSYSDHVIEFTIFDRAVGVLDLPTIFWEVRMY